MFLFVFLHIVTHILAHYRFAITALYYLPTAPRPIIPKTILYNETDTECAMKYMPH